ncbi:MAG: ATP-binding cassette domain-containing protein, partial [Lentisphaerae bacterium]|nr:ATP-binding cassette domain-containing protein [Lentisphaerota bacterium]
GSGKSVTLKHMIRLLTPDEGDVWVGDACISRADARELPALRDRFGVLFQGAALLQWLTVGDNVALPLREKTRMPAAEIDERVRARLRMLNLEDAFEKYPSDLSGGMQKRVGLARAIVLDPEIVLYDEPTSGLDPVTSRLIDDLIEDLRRKLGLTSVVVTHDLHSALAIASRIAVIHRGRIVEVSTPREFVRSKSEIVQGFLEAQYITRRGDWEGMVTP